MKQAFYSFILAGLFLSCDIYKNEIQKPAKTPNLDRSDCPNYVGPVSILDSIYFDTLIYVSGNLKLIDTVGPGVTCDIICRKDTVPMQYTQFIPFKSDTIINIGRKKDTVYTSNPNWKVTTKTVLYINHHLGRADTASYYIGTMVGDDPFALIFSPIDIYYPIPGNPDPDCPENY